MLQQMDTSKPKKSESNQRKSKQNKEKKISELQPRV